MRGVVESTNITRCGEHDVDAIYSIVNDAAIVYQGVIPDECLHDPYMSATALRDEILNGVEFWGYYDDDAIAGVMGIQYVRDVVLIRHAYTRTEYQCRGVGAALLRLLVAKTSKPVLIGTWSAVGRAISFYERNGFGLVSLAAKDRLLKKYWQVPPKQMRHSVVLANVDETNLKF